jgi:nicotinate-nucleotide pyrophosphorylase (carboxylating)
MNFTPSLAEVITSAEKLIALAMKEDIGSGDVTSKAVLPPQARAKAVIMAKAEGVIAGIPVVKAVFSRAVPPVEFSASVNDGARVEPSNVLAHVEGSALSILSMERIALNFLQRLSGIATLTSEYVKAVQGWKVAILDTRKTTPGYRELEKYAVRIGGGQNHRRGLYDMVLVKDNHIRIAGSVSLAVRRARETHPDLPLEVEVNTLKQLEEALSLPVDVIMLDNMDLEKIRKAVEITRNRVPLEVSGGVNLDTIRQIASTGVRYISVGALTHSAPALDVSLELTA